MKFQNFKITILLLLIIPIKQLSFYLEIEPKFKIVTKDKLKNAPSNDWMIGFQSHFKILRQNFQFRAKISIYNAELF